MPITTHCPCGAQFAAPEHAAGRKVKCPKCAQPVQVPSTAKAAAAGKPVEPLISVGCQCGKAIKVPAAFAGKSVKCPSCGQVVSVPKSPRTASRAKATPGKAPAQDGVGQLLDEVDLNLSKTGRRCPECRQDMELDDIVCVNCGYNSETGKKIKVQKVDRGRKIGSVTVRHQEQDAKADAPPAVQSLVKMVNQAGALAVLVAVGLVAYLTYGQMQGDLEKATEALLGVLTSTGGYLLGGAIVLITVPCAVAANLVQSGSSVGRIMCIVMGFVTIPVFLIGALIVKLALSDEVSRYCR